MQAHTLRNAYLEFLRNLTPQILLLTMTIILGMKLDLNRFDLNNLWPTLLFFSFVLVTFCAWFANMTNFLEHASRTNSEVDTATAALLKNKEIKPFIRPFKIIAITFRLDKFLFLKIAFAIIVVNLAYAAVFVSSIQNATNLYNLLHAIAKPIK